jgi:hypothetical protein
MQIIPNIFVIFSGILYQIQKVDTKNVFLMFFVSNSRQFYTFSFP